MENIFLLRDCSSNKCYGIIKCYNKTLKEFQDKIIDIKNNIFKDSDDWCIDDILEQIPEDWKYDYIKLNSDDEIDLFI